MRTSWPSWLSRPRPLPLLLGAVLGTLMGLVLGVLLRLTGVDTTTAFAPWAFIGGAAGVAGVIGYYRAR